MAKTILYGLTGLSWLVALVWVVVDPGFEPLLAFLAGCGSLVTTFMLPSEGASGDASVTFTNPGTNHGQQVGINAGTMHQSNQTITNTAPNQGAQGTFHGPVSFTQGTVDARDADFSGARGVTISGVTVDRRQHDQTDSAP